MIGIALTVALVVLVVMAVRARPRWVSPVSFALGVVLGAGSVILGAVIGLGGYVTVAAPVLGAVLLGLGLQRFVGDRRTAARGAAYALVGVAGRYFVVFLLLVAACGEGGCS